MQSTSTLPVLRAVAGDPIGRELCFAAVLRAAVSSSPRKSERTRGALLAAVAERLAMGDVPGALRVSDIATAAGVAHGTFYRYFADRPASVEAVLDAFILFVRRCLSAVRSGAPASPVRVRAATLVYIGLFRANPGLMRCLMGLGDETASFRARFHDLNRDWNRRVAAAIVAQRRNAGAAAPETQDAMLPTAYALGGMVDEFLTQLYLRQDPALSPLADDEEAVADLLTTLWCRAAYGADGGSGC